MSQNGSRGCTKAGRSKKKQAARSGITSQFVRGVISAHEYFAKTNQSIRG